MWPLCSVTSPLWIFLPLLIGLLTGWWAWARSRSNAGVAYSAPEPAPPPITSPKVMAPDTVPVRIPEPTAPVAAFEAPTVEAPKADIGNGMGGLGLAGAVGALTAIGVPAAVGDPDDLRQIKGIGPKLNSLLISLGVIRFDQIAAWGAAEIEKVDDHLGSFKNRITRDNWVEQADLLAKGMIKEFEAKFGKLDSENK
jgi:predicted flap endonuclease-1-like 5' DNA nuclease